MFLLLASHNHVQCATADYNKTASVHMHTPSVRTHAHTHTHNFFICAMSKTPLSKLVLASFLESKKFTNDMHTVMKVKFSSKIDLYHCKGINSTTTKTCNMIFLCFLKSMIM